jgi:hypothetical protein
VDDASGYASAVPITHKWEAAGVIKELITRAETQTGVRVKALRTDNGGEYIGAPLQAFLRGKGIEHQHSAPYTPQQNGKAENLNGILMPRVRAAMFHAGLPTNFWHYALLHVTAMRNNSPMAGKVRTPYELFKGKVPDLTLFRVLGCKAYVHVPDKLRKKLDPVSKEGILLGLSHAGYRVLVGDKVVYSRNVTFDETLFPFKLQKQEHNHARIEYVRLFVPPEVQEARKELPLPQAPDPGSVLATEPSKSTTVYFSDSNDEGDAPAEAVSPRAAPAQAAPAPAPVAPDPLAAPPPPATEGAAPQRRSARIVALKAQTQEQPLPAPPAPAPKRGPVIYSRTGEPIDVQL